MSKFGQYKINLLGVSDDIQAFTYELTDEYFSKIDSPEVQKGNIVATVKVQKLAGSYELHFSLNGIVLIPCDRCLDDMEQVIQHQDVIKVKLGSTFSEEDEIVIIPESEGYINIAWFLYEFIVLNIPIKHVHPTGECNKTMMSKLKKHIAYSKDDDENALVDVADDDTDTEDTEDTEEFDPRWKGLEDINFENN